MTGAAGERRPRRRPAAEVLRGRVPVLFFAAMVVCVGALVALSGCKIEMALDTVVEPDGSGSVGVRLAADKEIQDLISEQGGGEGDLFGEFESSVPEGWESNNGTDPDGTRWVSASRSFSNPAELQSFLEEGSEEGSPASSVGASDFSLTQESGFLTVKTVFTATWDMQDALTGTGEDLPPGLSPDALSSIFEVQNRLTLPGSIKENNADEVEGSTLTWRPTLSGVTEMNATSVAYKWPVVGGIAAAAVLLLVVVAVVAVILMRRRGAGTVEAAVQSQEPAPPFPPSPPPTPGNE